MVIGVLPDTSKTETLLNNLSEADFKLSNVSVITQDVKTRNAIAKDAGPFKGVTAPQLAGKLIRAGLPTADANNYQDAVTKGSVFVAIACPKESEPAAVEMLNDYSPQLVKVVH